jgi:excisionase family DNA binding protein
MEPEGRSFSADTEFPTPRRLYPYPMASASELTSTDLEQRLTSTLELSVLLQGNQLHSLVEVVTRTVLERLGDRPEYMDTKEVAEYLGWPKKRIDTLCDQGRIPVHSYGQGCRRTFIRQEIDEWMRQLSGTTIKQALMAA